MVPNAKISQMNDVYRHNPSVGRPCVPSSGTPSTKYSNNAFSQAGYNTAGPSNTDSFTRSNAQSNTEATGRTMGGI